MRAIGSGLGAAASSSSTTPPTSPKWPYGVSHGFSRSSRAASAHRARKTASCCRAIFDRVRRSEATDLDLLAIDDHLRTVTEGARCFLATQQQQVIASIMELEGDHLGAHARGDAGPADPILIGPLADIRDGVAVLDEHQLEKQPDWSFDAVDSGQSPAARFHDPHPNAGLTTLHPLRSPPLPPRHLPPHASPHPGACTKPRRCPRSSCTVIPRSGSTRARRSTPTTARLSSSTSRTCRRRASRRRARNRASPRVSTPYEGGRARRAASVRRCASYLRPKSGSVLRAPVISSVSCG